MKTVLHLWRRRRPIAGSTVIAFLNDEANSTPERIAAAVAEHIARAIHALTRRRKKPTLVQIHVECVDRVEQLIREKQD